eukprot:EG_transcript_12076
MIRSPPRFASLALRLYRSLLRKARHYDRHPAMKGILKGLDSFPALRLQPLYSPAAEQSFEALVRHAFRNPTPDGVTRELGFGVLKYLNEVDQRYFEALYGAPSPEAASSSATPAVAEPPATTAAPPSSTAPNRPRSPNEEVLERLLHSADRYWAMPISTKDLGRQPSGRPAGTALPLPLSAPSPWQRGAVDFHPLTPGVVLANHPMSEFPYAKCCLMILETSSHHSLGLLLNYPHDAAVGQRNFVFPPALRTHSCRIGGPLMMAGMPPVPNYYILHPYRELRNAKVLLADDVGHTVCVSTAEDAAEIADFIRRRRVDPEAFAIFAGAVLVPTADLQQQVQEGLWMPLLASASFVHDSHRLGPVLWDGLLQRCGGDFAHMPRVRSFVDSVTPIPPPAAQK